MIFNLKSLVVVKVIKMNETVEQLRQRARELRSREPQTSDYIDAINQVAWNLRNADTLLAAELTIESLQFAARCDYQRGRAFALRCLGVCRLRSDQYEQAAKLLLDSRAAFSDLSLPNSSGLAATIGALAISQKCLGELQTSLENCFAAVDLCRKSGEQNQSAIIYNNIADIYSCSGDYSTALDYYYQALQIDGESNKSVSKGWSYGNLSGVLWRVGEAETSIEYSQQAIKLLREHQDRRNEAMALVNLGAAWQSLGNHQNAWKNYLTGLQIAEETNSFEVQAEAHKCLGSLSLEKGEAEVALDYLGHGLEFSQSINSFYNEGETLLHLGSAYRQLKNGRESARSYEQALEISERLGFTEIRAKAHLGLSKLFEKQKKLSAALAHYQNFHRFWEQVFGGTSARRIERMLWQKECKNEQRRRPSLMRRASEQRRTTTASGHYNLTRQSRSALSPHKLQQIIEFIDDHLDQSIPLATLADLAALNYDHFIRCFKRATSKTPHQFLLDQRIERAKLLLRTTTLPLTEIALRCGFNSQPHLTTQFRLSTNITPHQFRQSA